MVFPGNVSMTPVGILMIEHRLIEHMIRLLSKELASIEGNKQVNSDFIDTAVDFIRTYADKCHHGKEEDIFFKVLITKKIKPQDKEYILELIEEHKQGRATIARLIAAKENYIKKESKALDQIVECIKWLIDFYPKHIKKEDKHFFTLYRTHLSEEEQDNMLLDFLQFGEESTQDKYAKIVEDLERIF